MNRKFYIGIMLSAVLIALPYYAAAQQEQTMKVISVSSIGTAKAKPDVAIITLEVKATAPLAKDALQECGQKVNEIKAKLRQLGIKDENVRFSGPQYAPAGSIRGVISTTMMRSTGFDVSNTFQVLIRDIDPAKTDELNARISSLLDDLSKAGASVISSAISSASLGGSSAVSFAIFDPGKYEKQAYEAAIEKARPVADEIAKRMGVKIAGIESVRSGVDSARSILQQVVRSSYATTDLLEFSYYSTSPTDISIREDVTVNFSFK
jgi:uncharacterized protein YggE